MLYAMTPTANKVNYRLQSFKENFGSNSIQAERLQNELNRIVPSEFLKNGKLVRPETFLKKHPEKAQEIADLLKTTPTTDEIYRQRQKNRKRRGEEEESRQEYYEKVKANNKIKKEIDENLSGLYTYKHGVRVPRNKSSAEMISYLKQSHKSNELINYIADNISTLNKGRRIPKFKGLAYKDIGDF